jgi:hypothetical protein
VVENARNRPFPEQGTVTVITVAIPASAVDMEWLGRCAADRARCPVCGSSGWLLPDALIAHELRAGIYAMNGFLRTTFNRQKFQGLFINTALGNFTGYVAGSLVTLVSTHHAVERRAIRNLFGVLPRKKIVVHMMPQWLEWLLALIVGFLVMEAVRYWFNHRKYAALLSALRPKRGTESDRPPAGRSEAGECYASDGGAAQEAPPKSGEMNRPGVFTEYRQ